MKSTTVYRMVRPSGVLTALVICTTALLTTAPPLTTAARAQTSASAVQTFYKDLNLTSDQKAKIKPILQDTGKQMSAVHKDTTLSPQDQKKKAAQIQLQAMQKIKPILTPDQASKLKGAMQKMASSAMSAHAGGSKM
jgi:Spy/CpxP family protein refolding chaperone